MKPNQAFLLLAAATLAAAILACTIDVGGPAYPSETIPVSTQAVGEMRTAIQTAVAAATESGQLTIIISETQLTSYLTYKFESQANPIFRNPQVYLRNNQIQIYGTARSGYLQATARVVMAPAIDENGKLYLELVSADFGPLPIPEGLREAVTAVISEAYTGALGPVATGFRLQTIIVAEGYMLLIGTIR
ncbi:MAG: hypothetical protein ABWK53_05600 [Anaerolineales bacterium]